MADTVQEQPKWYSMTPEAVAQQLKVDPAKGLSAAEAQQRLQQYGPNVLAAKKKESGWQAFLRQYQDFMQILLVGVAVISLVVTREAGTTLVLLGLTVFNAILGLRRRIQGRGQPGRAREDDEEHHPGTPRRPGD